MDHFHTSTHFETLKTLSWTACIYLKGIKGFKNVLQLFKKSINIGFAWIRPRETKWVTPYYPCISWVLKCICIHPTFPAHSMIVLTNLNSAHSWSLKGNILDLNLCMFVVNYLNLVRVKPFTKISIYHKLNIQLTNFKANVCTI